MNVVFCGETNYPICSYPTHAHKNWEIIINTSGKNTTVIGDKSFEILPDSIIVLPPKTPHSAISKIGYTDMYIEAVDLDFSSAFVINDPDGNIQLLTKMIRKIMVEKEENYLKIADSLLAAICQIIKKHKNESNLNPLVFEFKNLLYTNISNSEFSVDSAAKSLDYNTDYLRRLFIRELKKTPKKYLTDLRLEQAKNLLTKENFISIEDVAVKCGFNDAFYFSTAFKKEFGISPSQYRKEN